MQKRVCASLRDQRVLKLVRNMVVSTSRRARNQGAKLRRYMKLALITEAIRRGSARCCVILDRRIPLEKLINC